MAKKETKENNLFKDDTQPNSNIITNTNNNGNSSQANPSENNNQQKSDLNINNNKFGSSKKKSDINNNFDNKIKNENNTKKNENNKFDKIKGDEIIKNKSVGGIKDSYERSKNHSYYNSNYKENFDIIEVNFIKISGNLFQQEKSIEFETNLLQNFSQSNNQNLIDQEMSNLEGNNIEFLNLY